MLTGSEGAIEIFALIFVVIPFRPTLGRSAPPHELAAVAFPDFCDATFRFRTQVRTTKK
jgi:hypothetical protein